MGTPNTDQSQTTVGLGSTASLGSMVRGRAEWLDLLHKCQNGEVTCLFVLKEMEAEMERENARLWEVGQRLRDKLAFELECIGDSGDRDITEWDSLLPNGN